MQPPRLLRRFGTPEPDLGALDAPYPEHRVQRRELPDGTDIRLRPIVPDDAVELRRGLARLSERTRWLRFHAPVSELSDEELRQLVVVDHHEREAIVAEVRHRLIAWQPVGVARYAELDDRRVEFAIVVEDAWQGKGLGRILLGALFDAARDEGYVYAVGFILRENTGLFRLLDSLGVRYRLEDDGTEVIATVDLSI